MKRSLIGTDRVDLVRDDPARKLVPEVERLYRASAGELVPARAANGPELG